MVIGTHTRTRERWQPTGWHERTQTYYVSREMPADSKDYWAPAMDPDGWRRDRLANEEEERQRYLADLAEEIEFANACGPQSVLDFGAGLGWFLDAIENPATWKAAIETSPLARERLEAKAGILLYDSLAEVETSSRDLVIAHHVFEHLKDPIAAIAQVRRILMAGGHLILATPDFDSPCAKRFGSRYRMLHDPTHVSLFTLESMHRFVRDHGFTIRDVRFPFPDRYATPETMARWLRADGVSPPWPGNWMTFYCRR